MQLKRINSAIDRVGRNDINENFGILERTYGKTAIDAETAKEQSLLANEIAETAVETSDEAKRKAESVQAQFNQVVVEGDSSIEAAQARVSVDATYDTLKARLDAENEQVTQQLAQANEELLIKDRALGYYWLPELQPPARRDHPNSFTDAYNWTSQQYIDNDFEPLRLAHSNYVTRTTLGKDQSGEYDVYRYIFTPKNYTKTIVITTGTHGGEITPVVTMARFFHYLCNEWEKYPALADIRANVRIVYIPFVNPWGMSQFPRTRYNSRGVDINRNADYKHAEYVGDAPFSQDYKGEAPFSEKESQYVRDTLLEFPDAVTFLDLHNTGTPSWDYYIALPENYEYKTYDKLLSYFTKEINSPSVSIPKLTAPTLANWAYNRLGINASIPEWCDTRYGGVVYGSEDITKSLEWFTNVIIEHTREFDLTKPIVKERYFTFSGTAINITATTNYTEVTQLKQSFKVPCDGVVLFEGFVTILGGAVGDMYWIVPMLGNGTAYNTIRATEWENYSKAQANDRITIPFQASIPIKKSVNTGDVHFGIAAKTSSEAFQIYRYRGRVTFLPTDTRNFDSKQIVL